VYQKIFLSKKFRGSKYHVNFRGVGVIWPPDPRFPHPWT